MGEYSRFNIVYRLQRWMDSVPGQTFLNYAYSWGASIVILGTLFKLTHLPGANLMLFLGMGTEVVVFFLSAFDRPFDKTADGRELPTHLKRLDEEGNEIDDEVVEETVAPAYVGGQTVIGGQTIIGGQPVGDGQPVSSGQSVGGGQPVAGGGTIIIGGGVGGGAVAAASAADGDESTETVAPTVVGGQAAGVGQVVGGGAPATWIAGQQENTPEMVEAQSNYVDALNQLTDMLSKVSAQSERLTRDSEEMENLNRTLTGIAKVYELQLKAASQQVGTIDQINAQTRKMAELIEQLNSIYGRMIEAMTVNMRVAAPGLGNQD